MAEVQDFEKNLDGSASGVASFDTHESFLKKAQHFLHGSPAAVPLIILIVSVAIFGILLPGKFFTPRTLSLILEQVAIVGIVGTAQTLVVLTAGIDLSVGAIMVLSSIVIGQFGVKMGLPWPVALAIGIAVGTACGFINGWLVAKVKLPPFIATLGTWQIYAAAVYIYANNETIRSQDIDAASSAYKVLGTPIKFDMLGTPDIPGDDAVVTYGVFLMIAITALLWYVLNHTAWGRHVYAVGDDPASAELAGVRVDRMLLSVYVVAGLIAGIAGWALIGRVGSISPQSGQYANIDSITAVVIGGTSLFGGRGSILGTIFGALTVGVFALGLRLLGTDPQYTFMTTGALIIAAVAIDQWIRKVAG